MSLSLSLLGPWMATLDERPLALTAKKPQGLLAYLAVESARPHYREALCGLFWPDYPEASARASLRQALQLLRRALDGTGRASPPCTAGVSPAPARPALILVARETMQLNRAAGYRLDVDILDAATAAVLAPSPRAGGAMAVLAPADVEALRAAVALVRGPFLEGFSLAHSAESPAFEEWLLLKREQVNRQALQALHALAMHDEARGAWDEALAYARRILALEPWHEEAHQQAMRLLALLGRRSEALAQYRRCREIILRELGSEPGPEITSLYQSIRDTAIPAPCTAGVLPAFPTPAPISLVAREGELGRLEGYLREALAGEGRIALVTGETGSGKTALLEGFACQALGAHEELLVTVGRCTARSGGRDPYEAVHEALRALAGEPEGLLGSRHEQRLQAALPLALEALAMQGPDLVRWLARDTALGARARACAPRGAPWLPRLQALSEEGASPNAPGLLPSALCDQVTRVLRALAQRRPLLLLLDDLQWADTSTLDLLFYLARRLACSRLFILGAYRAHDLAAPSDPAVAGAHPLAALADELQRLWGDIRIDLTQAEPRHFVDAYLDSWPNRLRAPFRQTLARHTDGNSLFTIELLQAMQERGDLVRDGRGQWIEGPDLSWDHLPPRVEGAISYRIGQLASAQQELLEVASVEGEQFHAEVLAHVLRLPLRAVIATLSGPLGRQAHLVAPGGLLPIGSRELARYRFRHGLFQSYLYGRLDPTIRAHWHGAVAAAIESLYAEQAPRLAVDLARHHQEAGQAAETVAYLLEMGRRAAALGAHREAIASYERALALLEDSPTHPERAALEFALQGELDYSLQYVEGWGSPARSRANSRAYALGRQMGWSTPAAIDALERTVDLHAARGEFARTIELVGELLGAAERLNDHFHIVVAQTVLSRCYLMRGDLAQGWEYISRALASDLQAASQANVTRVANLALQREISAAIMLLTLGQPERAWQHLQRTLAASKEVFAPENAVYLHGTVGLIYAAGHMDRLARAQGIKVLEIVAGRELPEMEAWGNVLLGWAEARAGQAGGVARAAQALEAQRPRGTMLGHYLREMLLVEAHMAAGQAQQALHVIERALRALDETDTRYCESPLYCLRGEALWRGAVPTETTPLARCAQPDACFQRAIDVARQQGARLWELRATTSLARWRQQEGRDQEARGALAAIYATFDEGCDAPDLVEARALLDALGTS